MVDLDRFKDLNDTLGHHAGDLLLVNLGARLQRGGRERGLVARLGGDEFALLLPDAGLARAADVGRRIGAALQAPFEIDGLEVVMDASIGAALCPDHGTDGGRAAAARGRRHVPGQGRPHRLPDLRPVARPPLARAPAADRRAAPRARARRARPALPAEGQPRDRPRRRRRGARALAAPRARPARPGRVPPARRAHGADAPAHAARAGDRAGAARRSGARRAWSCTSPSTSPSRTCSTCARRARSSVPSSGTASRRRRSRSRSPSR